MPFSYKIYITGAVQGVGFRPYVFRTALKYNIRGFVANEKGGVIIEAEGQKENLNQFLRTLEQSPYTPNKPEVVEGVKKRYDSFQIYPSDHASTLDFLSIPDKAICPECLEELNNGRRKNYVFNSCAACGPRYTIMKGLPFDRAFTSMNEFPLCPDCTLEYTGLNDRRFHAQTISCSKCGPKLRLQKGGRFIEGGMDVLTGALQNDEVAAIQATGGFYLVGNAKSSRVVSKIREIKRRPHKPLAVMFASCHDIEERFYLSPAEKKALLSPQRPIVVLKNRHFDLSEKIHPGLKKTGVFLPDSALFFILLQKLGFPLVATSMNVTEEPMFTHYLQFDKQDYGNLLIAFHDRKIENFTDDSVLLFAKEKQIFLRKSKGYLPSTGRLPFPVKPLLALGAGSKVSPVLAKGETYVQGPFYGSLDSLEARSFFREHCKKFLSFYDFQPKAVVCDYHPGYFTTELAREWAQKENLDVFFVYHHHAHAASLMIDAGIKPGKKFTCAVWDGAGFGADRTIWGGEFLEASYTDFTRFRSFLPFSFFSHSERAPWKSAASLLFQIFGQEALKKFSFSDPERTRILYEAWKNNVNTIASSSVGRFFDAAASILGLCHEMSYEAQAAILLEQACDSSVSDFINMPVINDKIDWRPLFEALALTRDVVYGASLFLNSMAQVLNRVGESIGELGLSGGVFQNAALVSKISDLALKNRWKLYLHRDIPCNDAGISAGQAAVGAARTI